MVTARFLGNKLLVNQPTWIQEAECWVGLTSSRDNPGTQCITLTVVGMRPPDTTCRNSVDSVETPTVVDKCTKFPRALLGGKPRRAQGQRAGRACRRALCPQGAQLSRRHVREQPQPTLVLAVVSGIFNKGVRDLQWVLDRLWDVTVARERAFVNVTTLLINSQLETPEHASQPMLRVLTTLLTSWATSSVVPFCLGKRPPPQTSQARRPQHTLLSGCKLVKEPKCLPLRDPGFVTHEDALLTAGSSRMPLPECSKSTICCSFSWLRCVSCVPRTWRQPKSHVGT